MLTWSTRVIVDQGCDRLDGVQVYCPFTDWHRWHNCLWADKLIEFSIAVWEQFLSLNWGFKRSELFVDLFHEISGSKMFTLNYEIGLFGLSIGEKKQWELYTVLKLTNDWIQG